MVPIVQQHLAMTANPSAGQPAAPPQRLPGVDEVRDDDYLTGAQAKALIARAAEGFTPRIDQGTAMGATLAVQWARDKYADDFRRFGPEIEVMIANLPAHQRTLDNLAQTVKFVRGNHLDEILEEERTKLRQEFSAQGGTLRSGGGPSGPGLSAVPTDEFDLSNAPPAWRDKAQRLGLTSDTVRNFATKNGLTAKEFYEGMTISTDRIANAR